MKERITDLSRRESESNSVNKSVLRLRGGKVDISGFWSILLDMPST